MSKKKFIKVIIVAFMMVAIGFLFIIPLVWMVSTSVKPDEQIFLIPPKWIPNPIKWENYSIALNYFPFWLNLRNTCIITFIPLFGMLLSSSLVAYAFACLRWRGRSLLFVICLATLMIPRQVTLIPLYVIFSKIGWVGTFLPLIVPAFMGGGAFNIFLLRQFLLTIPSELSDAARIDGASKLSIYFKIMLPLLKPALAVVGLFFFVFRWNDFIGPLIYLIQWEEKYPLSLGLIRFTTSFGQTEFSYLMAASTVVLLPIIIVFLFTQRYFIEGISLTGIKQ